MTVETDENEKKVVVENAHDDRAKIDVIVENRSSEDSNAKDDVADDNECNETSNIKVDEVNKNKCDEICGIKTMPHRAFSHTPLGKLSTRQPKQSQQHSWSENFSARRNQWCSRKRSENSISQTVQLELERIQFEREAKRRYRRARARSPNHQWKPRE